MLTKQSYPLSIVVNKEGRRFIDEGDDFRNYTYAKYGAAILERPGAVAFQLFHKTVQLLRQDEYTAPSVSRYESDTIEGLTEQLGIEPTRLEQAISEFNSAVRSGSFNPAIKDGGKRTVGKGEHIDSGLPNVYRRPMGR